MSKREPLILAVLNLSMIDREFEFEIYTSPKNKLIEGKFNADYGHSLKEQVEKIAERQGVLEEYKAEYKVIIANSQRKTSKFNRSQ